MKLAIGSDHLGFALKEIVKEHIKENHPHVDVADLGPAGTDPIDYPDVGFAVASAVGEGTYERGILICGTGAGMCICANKIPGVRAVVCHDPYTAERAQKSNNAQIMALGAQIIGPEPAKMLVSIWLNSEFQGGRSLPKVAKIEKMDQELRKVGVSDLGGGACS